MVYIFLLLDAATDEERYTTELTPIVATLIAAMKGNEAVKATLQQWILECNWPNNQQPQLPEKLRSMIKRRDQQQLQEEEEKEILLDKPQSSVGEQPVLEQQQPLLEQPLLVNSAELETNEDSDEDLPLHSAAKPELLDAPDMEFNEVKSVLVRLMTCSNYNVKSYVGEFLFHLCDQNPEKLTAHTGFGNAVGLLAEKGLLGNLLNQK